MVTRRAAIEWQEVPVAWSAMPFQVGSEGRKSSQGWISCSSGLHESSRETAIDHQARAGDVGRFRAGQESCEARHFLRCAIAWQCH